MIVFLLEYLKNKKKLNTKLVHLAKNYYSKTCVKLRIENLNYCFFIENDNLQKNMKNYRNQLT